MPGDYNMKSIEANKLILPSQQGEKPRQQSDSQTFVQNADGVVINPIIMKSVYLKKPEELSELGVLRRIATKTVDPVTLNGMKKEDSLREFKYSKIFDSGNKDVVDDKINEMYAAFEKLDHPDCSMKRR